MKKILFSIALALFVTLNVQTAHAQWTQLNTGWPVYSGSLDPCNGIAFSNTQIYATTNHGIIRCPRSTSGQLTGTWSKPPLQPFPTYPATSIVNSGDLVYYLVPGVGVIYTSTNATVFQTSSNVGLATFSGIGELFVVGTYLYLLDMDAHVLYRKLRANYLTPWTYIPAPDMETIPYGFTCAKARGSGLFIGTTNSIVKVTLGTVPTVQTVMTGKYCYSLEPLNHLNNITYRKEVLALISDGSGFPHPTADFVRYDNSVPNPPTPGTWIKVHLGKASTHLAQILSTQNNTNTNRYYCTNFYLNPLDVNSLTHIGKSIDFATFTAGDYMGLPSGIMGGSTIYSRFSSFGNTVSGTSYLFAPYIGFYYHSPLVSMKTENSDNAFTELSNDELSIFPNPTTQYFQIQGNNEHSYQIGMVDGNGKWILRSEGGLEKINNELSSIKNLANGIYFLQIKDMTTQEVKTEKLLKQ